MSYLTIAAVIIFVGYSMYARIHTKPSDAPSSSPQVISETDEKENLEKQESPSPRATVVPNPTPIASANSQIKIKVDSTDGKKTEELIFPQAIKTGNNQYSTDKSGEEVYNWYKEEMQKRSYQIRNNVKTRANEKFKAVLQGVSSSSSLKVTIDQENSKSKTIITLE